MKHLPAHRSKSCYNRITNELSSLIAAPAGHPALHYLPTRVSVTVIKDSTANKLIKVSKVVCLNDIDLIHFLIHRLNFQTRQILHTPRFPLARPAALHPALMSGPVTATSRPVSVLFLSQSHPAVPEEVRPGKRQQSASWSKRSLVLNGFAPDLLLSDSWCYLNSVY